MRYRAALFDADETLFDFAAAERAALIELISFYGIKDDDAPARYHAINADCWREYEKGAMTQAQLKEIRMARLFERYGVSADLAEAAIRYEDALAAHAMLLPGALETVRAVAERMPVAIVTNGIARVQRRRLASSPIYPFISAVVISEEVGAAKPDPKMVFHALRQLGGIAPDEAILIGDSLTSDMKAAANAGVDACWLNRAGAIKPDHCAVQYMISDIREAVPIAFSEEE